MKKWLRRFGYFLIILLILINIISAFHAYKFSHYYEKKDASAVGFGKQNIFGKMGYILFGPKFAKSEIDSIPQYKFRNLSIVASDNKKLAAWWLQHGIDDTLPKKGTMLLFHGVASCRSSLADEIDFFYTTGWDVFTIDFRGSGQSEGYTTTFSANEIKDVKAAYDFIQATGENTIAMYGQSMGAACVLRATSVYKLKPYAIISDASFGSIKEGVEGRVRMMGLPAEPLASLMCFWGGLEEGYWAFGIQQTEYARDITCPVLLQRGAVDVRVTKKETENIYKNLASANKKLIEYEECGHESFIAKWPEEWGKNVSEFLSR